jgi:putative ABC transport system ATP-binding protein
MNVLEVKNVRKVYGSRLGGSVCNALNGFDLEVEEGEFVGIMGPSGAGKTTLLNIISTIDEPTSGNIFISGNNLKNLKEPKLSIFRRNMLGFIFQEFNLLDTLTIKENVILPLVLSGIKVGEIEERVKHISEILGISEILNKYPYEVSGGQKQKCAAARAVINNPRLILADEPVGSLDSKSSKDLLECLAKLNEINKSTILMVTHDAFAASYCKRIVFIKDGTLFSEIARADGRKEFFNQIIDVLSAMEGDVNELL